MTWLVVLGAVLLIGSVFLLFEERRAHVLGVLPYALGAAALVFCIVGDRLADLAQARRRRASHGGAR